MNKYARCPLYHSIDLSTRQQPTAQHVHAAGNWGTFAVAGIFGKARAQSRLSVL